MTERTLIVYSTKVGATEKTANQIADVLRDKFGLEVDLVNLVKQSAPCLDPYGNIVVGTGIQQGEIYEETKIFLAKDLKGKKLAYFTCSGFIYPKTYEGTTTRYITEVLCNYQEFKPIATESFGGYLKILGLPVSRKMDPAKVEAWAEELGKKFTEQTNEG